MMAAVLSVQILETIMSTTTRKYRASSNVSHGQTHTQCRANAIAYWCRFHCQKYGREDKFIAYADIQGQRAVICLLEKSTVNVFV